MNVLAFAASNSTKSINKQLVTYATRLLEKSRGEVIDINDYAMPIYSADIEEAEGIPPLAVQFKEKIAQADALIIAFAEHNGSYTAAYKNLFDWLSRIDRSIFQNKPLVYLASSPGPGGAKNVLQQAVAAAPHFDGRVVASFSLPSFNENFDQKEQCISDLALREQLQEALKHIDT